MAKFSYKKYAGEVVEKLFEVDDIEIYEKFIKEFERLTKQDQYKKEEVRCCGTCFNAFAGYCEEKDSFVKEDNICDKYESAREVERKWLKSR